jgi:Flp pilus assembly protein TadG
MAVQLQRSAALSLLTRVVGAWRERLCRATLDFRRPVAEQQGQSMTELAMLTPLLVLGVLGTANLGLALHAHTGLAQVTQQAAQYLLQHPASSTCGLSTNTYQSCTEKQVADYLSAHGFVCSAADGGGTLGPTTCRVTVTFNTMTVDPVSGQQELIATITVTYPYSLVMPIPAALNSGPLHGNTITLNAQVATIVAADAPTAVTVTPITSGQGLQGYKVSWSAPYWATHASPSSASLQYRVYSHGIPLTGDGGLISGPPYLDYCGPAPSAGPQSAVACAADNYSYQVTAVQPNGMESAMSAPVQYPAVQSSP